MSNEIKIKNISVAICDLFETVLKEHDIYIPDEARTGDESEACLYGTAYYDLEESITKVLVKLAEEIKSNPSIIINKEEF